MGMLRLYFKTINPYLLLLVFFASVLFVSCKSLPKKEGERDTFTCPPSQKKVTVVRAIDGDTVELSGMGKLRYAGVNTPELHTDWGRPEPFAVEAFNRNRELTEGKEFCLELSGKEKDRYGRFLGELYFPNGTSVSEILVSEGLAFVCYYEGSGKFYEKLLPVQRTAIKERRGLFSYVDRPEAKTRYIGNKNSKRFHHPECREVEKIKKKVIFKDLESALYEGYCPSRECSHLIFF